MGSPVHVRLVFHQPTPVLSPPPAIRYGFEGGRVVRVGGQYHLFTTEQVGDPFAVATRLAHWTSPDQPDDLTHLMRWTRVATLREGSGDYTGGDPRAVLWSPLPVYDPVDDRWNLFYIAYRAAPGPNRTNYEGRVWRARATTAGVEGVGGPYDDLGIILEPGPESDAWEGLQGTDSFFPYPVGDRWYALYGSAHNEQEPASTWRVGLATAPRLGGPWTRCSERNPLPIEPRFIENPIVAQLPSGAFLAVYDTGVNDPHALGWAWSPDGVTWERGEPLRVPSWGTGGWVELMRTPLGLVLESEHRATIFYTGYRQDIQDAEALTDPTGKATGGSPWGVASVGVLTVQLQ